MSLKEKFAPAALVLAALLLPAVNYLANEKPLEDAHVALKKIPPNKKHGSGVIDVTRTTDGQHLKRMIPCASRLPHTDGELSSGVDEMMAALKRDHILDPNATNYQTNLLARTIRKDIREIVAECEGAIPHL